MPEYRFGVSLLSKDRYKDAYNQELMVDKLTGEVLVKTPTGDTISYNYNSRLKSHIVETKSIANNVSVYGDIISIEMDDKYAPFTMDFDTNYITSELVFPYENCKKILFNADIDAITIDPDGISHERNNMLLELELSVIFNDNTNSDKITLNYSMDKLNHKVLNLTNNSLFTVPTNKTISGFILSGFKIKNTLVDYITEEEIGNDTNIRPIFNSLFVVIQV